MRNRIASGDGRRRRLIGRRRRLALLQQLENRHLLAGDLDLSFGDDGTVTTELFHHRGSYEEAHATAIDGSGRIIAVGSGGQVIRYATDGSLDTTFGDRGFAPFPGGAGGVSVQSDGKILVAGSSFNGDTSVFTLARYLPDGSLDSSFDDDGKLTTAFASLRVVAKSVALQQDGKIVVAGESRDAMSTNSDIVVARYLADGSLDSTFASDGKLSTDIGTMDYSESVAIQSDGKIVVAGYGQNGSHFDYALARYHADGSLDTNFGTNGTLTTAVSELDDFGQAMAIQDDGNIVMAGRAMGVTGFDVALARYRGGAIATPATLSVNITSASISENGGTATLTVTRDTPDSSQPLVVAIKSNDLTEAIVQPTVTIAAGQSSATAAITAVDDMFFDGDQVVTVTADTSPAFVLDPTFSDDGIQSISFIDGGGQVPTNARQFVQQDGKILTVYNKTNNLFYLRRHDANGELDLDFGTDGLVIGNLVSNGAESIADIIQQADGKIVVAGTIGNTSIGFDAFIARYELDGSVDSSFGSDGSIILNNGINRELVTGVLELNGKLVLIGGRASSASVSAPMSPTLWRFHADGDLDVGIHGLPLSNAYASGHAVQGDGKIVVTGSRLDGTGNSELFAARWNADGTADSSFGTAGISVIDSATDAEAGWDVAIQADGKIVVVGWRGPASSDRDAMLTRLNADGSLDSSFGTGGKLVSGVAGQFDYASEIEITQSGLMLVGINTTGNDVILNAFSPEGVLLAEDHDTITSSWDSSSPLHDMILQPDGKLLVTFYGPTLGIYRFDQFAFDNFIGASESITVVDDEVGLLEFSFEPYEGTFPSVTENKTLEITLTRQGSLAADLVVDLISSDETEFVTPDTVTIADGQSSVTFIGSGVQDGFNDGTAALSLRATAPLYEEAWEIIRVLDDPAPRLSLSLADPAISENGGSTTLTVTRFGMREDPLMISLSSSDLAKLSLPSTLSFDANVASLDVVLTAVDDEVFDGTQTVLVTADWSEEQVSQSISLDITDDDLAGVTITPTTGLVTTESGGTATYTAALTSQPTADVTFRLVSSDSSEGTAAPSSLSFNASNWDVPQTVTITGVDDTLTDGDIVYRIINANLVSEDPNYNTLKPADVFVTNLDNDSASLSLAIQAASISEAAGAAATSATVTRNTNTSDPLVVTLTNSDASEASVPATVTIPAGQASVTFAIDAVDDWIIDGTQAVVISAAAVDHTGASGSLNVTDDDVAGLTIIQTNGSTSVSESGTTDTFSVAITAQPLSDVVLTLSSGDPGEVTLSPTTLTFTPDSWNIAQSVTVTGVDDLVFDGNQTTAITIGVNAAVSDDAFGEVVDRTVAVTTLDDETPTLTLTIDPATFSEGGGSGAAVGRLTRNDEDLSQAITVQLSSSDTSEARVPATVIIPAGQDSITFPIDAIDDPVIDGDAIVTVTAVQTAAGVSLDGTFGPGGRVDTPLLTRSSASRPDLVILDDGSILATSEAETGTTYAWQLVKYTAEGVLDTTFATDGVAKLNVGVLGAGGAGFSRSIAIQADGKILVGGRAIGANDVHADLVVARYNSDGSTDTAFASDGLLRVETLGGFSEAENVLVQSDGRIVVIGISQSSVFVGRFLPDGTFDTSFGNSGQLLLPFNQVGTPKDALLLDDDRIVFAGWGNSTQNAMLVTRLNADGAWDLSFSGDGRQQITFPTATAIPAALALQSDGKLVVAGSVFDDFSDQIFGAARLNMDGSLDAAFATDGRFIHQNPGQDDQVHDVVIQPSGRILLVGRHMTQPTTTGYSHAILGLTPAGQADKNFADDGLWLDVPHASVFEALEVAKLDAQGRLVAVSGYYDDIDLIRLHLGKVARHAAAAVTVTDNDSPGFTVTQSGGATSVSEDGTTDSFDVVLNAQPLTDVVLTVVSGDVSEATVSPATLLFTPSNWNVAQSVTVTGVDDAIVDGDQTTTITVGVNAAESDDAFDSLADQTVSVTTLDNDRAGNEMEVLIDIKPGGASNPINPGSGGTTVVAILSTSTFDAVGDTEVSSLTFGRTGDEASLAYTRKHAVPEVSVRDINHDGLDDLLVQFVTRDTGFVVGDTEGVLRGQTQNGQAMQGRDVVRIVGNAKTGRPEGEMGAAGNLQNMDAVWNNWVEPMDVNDNGIVSALDALVVLNAIRQGRGGTLPPLADDAEVDIDFLDTNGDGRLTPLDALLVLNQMQRRSRAAAISAAAEHLSHATPMLDDDRIDDAIELLATDFTRARR